MKRLAFLSLFLVLAASSFAQFKIDTETYEKRKQEALETQRVQDSLRRVQLEDQRIKANDIRFRLKWVNWLTFNQSIGFVESRSNLTYSGYFQTKNTWTIPINVRFSSSKSYNEAALDDHYDANTWKKYVMDLGLSGFRNLKDDFYLSLGMQLPVGWERYSYADESKRHTHLLAGVGTEERIFYMSPNKVGLILGVGLYQQLMSSRLYTVDMGLNFDVGIKF
ncbi:MAG: hypothetical protein Q8914_09465 [Bacteroidota bacterium]|nr:hypothetical protein [Bacteroidota bacterium]